VLPHCTAAAIDDEDFERDARNRLGTQRVEALGKIRPAIHRRYDH
jgi:hypothetical protein